MKRAMLFEESDHKPGLSDARHLLQIINKARQKA